jgi:hypothetical protein
MEWGRIVKMEAKTESCCGGNMNLIYMTINGTSLFSLPNCIHCPVAELDGPILLIPTPAIRHDPEPVTSTPKPHNLTLLTFFILFF